jgi:hypothetical protein
MPTKPTTSSRSTADGLAAALEALVRRVVHEELAARRAHEDGWVAVHEYLGCTRREASERCRAGEIPGAGKLGKVWRARRSAIDAAMDRLCASESTVSEAGTTSFSNAKPGDATLRALLSDPSGVARTTRRR